MTTIREAIRRRFAPVKPIPPGLYSYQAPPSSPQQYRLHLRMEEDGTGILIVNASTVLHLNSTAAEFTYYYIRGVPEEQAARQVASRFRVGLRQARQDFHELVERITALIESPDLDPVTYLEFERLTPYSKTARAPYRLDCALTYRLEPGSTPQAAPLERVTGELSTLEWKTILDKAWTVGIPHVIFTGGEPTLRDDLFDLISYAETNGQVTGILTGGQRLSDPTYLEDLLQTGIDHLTLIFIPGQESSWSVLDSLLAADLFVAVHLTLTPQNAPQMPSILEQLKEKGVQAVSLSETAIGLNSELQSLRKLAADLDLSLIWDIPVPYSAMNPVSLETQEPESPAGAGQAWLYVEPDGDVLPSQGTNRVLGNFLKDSWEHVWGAARESN